MVRGSLALYLGDSLLKSDSLPWGVLLLWGLLLPRAVETATSLLNVGGPGDSSITGPTPCVLFDRGHSLGGALLSSGGTLSSGGLLRVGDFSERAAIPRGVLFFNGGLF